MTKETFIKRFTSNLKHVLRVNGMTQEQLAHEVGVTKPTINRYLSGEILPPLDKFNNLVFALDCQISDLLEIRDFVD